MSPDLCDISGMRCLQEHIPRWNATTLYFEALLKGNFHKEPSFKNIRNKKYAKKINVWKVHEARRTVELSEGAILSIEGKFYDLCNFF